LRVRWRLEQHRQSNARRAAQPVSHRPDEQPLHEHIRSQYGCGSTGNVIKSVFVGVPNNNLTDAQIHSILQTAINNNTLPEPTNHSNLYMVFLDDATGVNDTSVGIVMCEKTSDDAFGYHDFFRTTAGNACVYGVIPVSPAHA